MSKASIPEHLLLLHGWECLMDDLGSAGPLDVTLAWKPAANGHEDGADDVVPPVREPGFERGTAVLRPDGSERRPFMDACMGPGVLCENISDHIFSHMRTTIDINDELLRAVKAHAAGERKTLKATIEEALREFLAGPRPGVADAPPIPVFRGRGVQPGVDLTDNAALEGIMDAES